MCLAGRPVSFLSSPPGLPCSCPPAQPPPTFCSPFFPLFSSVTTTVLGLPRTLLSRARPREPGGQIKRSRQETGQAPTAYHLTGQRALGSPPTPLIIRLSPRGPVCWVQLGFPLLGATISKSPHPQEEKGELFGRGDLPQHTHPRTQTQDAQGIVAPSPSIPSSPRGFFRPKFTPSTQTCVSKNSQQEKLPVREKERKPIRPTAGKQVQLPDLAQDFVSLARPHYPSFFFLFGRRAKKAAIERVGPYVSIGHTRGEKADLTWLAFC